ncbi:MAG TPA: rod shape-determining protein MreD [Chitinispirillaceae bacterium]|nr:rod shape-determining protein MreD [Chitinispirillaceae bacterium]
MIRTIITWFVLFFAAFILQTTLMPSVAILTVKPDLIVIVLFLMAMKTGIIPAVLIGFVLGLAQDIYTTGILGQNALAKTVAGFAAGLFNEKVMRVDPFLEIVLLLLTFIVNDIVYSLVNVIKFGYSFPAFGMDLLTSTLPRAVYSLLIALVPIVWEHYFKPSVKR